MTRRLGIRQNLRRITLLVALAAIASLYLFGADALAQNSKKLMKPTGLEATVVTAGIQLDWTTPRANVAEISGYKLERRRPGHGESRLIVLVNDTGSTDTTYVDSTAAAEGTEFIYRVRALRGSATSARSNKLVVTWNAADAVDTTDAVDTNRGNTIEYVDGDDNQQESVLPTSEEAHAREPLCGGNPSACLPWVQYSEITVGTVATNNWWGGGGSWSLRMRPPSFMPSTPHQYEYDYRLWTGRAWGAWVGGNDPVPYVEVVVEVDANGTVISTTSRPSGNWVTVGLGGANSVYCGKYVQHRVRVNFDSSGNSPHVTDYAYTDTLYVPQSCLTDPVEEPEPGTPAS